MNQIEIEDAFASSMVMPPLVIASGPAEVQFTGQSEAGQTPIGTGFIQGTDSVAASPVNPALVIAGLALAVLIAHHMGWIK